MVKFGQIFTYEVPAIFTTPFPLDKGLSVGYSITKIEGVNMGRPKKKEGAKELFAIRAYVHQIKAFRDTCLYLGMEQSELLYRMTRSLEARTMQLKHQRNFKRGGFALDAQLADLILGHDSGLYSDKVYKQELKELEKEDIEWTP